MVSHFAYKMTALKEENNVTEAQIAINPARTGALRVQLTSKGQKEPGTERDENHPSEAKTAKGRGRGKRRAVDFPHGNNPSHTIHREKTKRVHIID